jgi:hypothetical protein
MPSTSARPVSQDGHGSQNASAWEGLLGCGWKA